MEKVVLMVTAVERKRAGQLRLQAHDTRPRPATAQQMAEGGWWWVPCAGAGAVALMLLLLLPPASCLRAYTHTADHEATVGACTDVQGVKFKQPIVLTRLRRQVDERENPSQNAADDGLTIAPLQSALMMGDLAATAARSGCRH
jgi:hypothetical protein